MVFYYEGQAYKLQNDETVLDCLLRNNVSYNHSCKSGICQSCIARISTGDINSLWQKGLKETLQSQGYFLPCIAKLESSITFSTSENDVIETTATIKELDYLNYNVMSVKLIVGDFSAWIAGQYINLINNDGDSRSYSIANIPYSDNYIELHIKIIDNGKIGNWLKNDAKVNSTVKLRGPSGDCFYYNPKKESYPLLLAGTGTGLAPLIGIIKDAIKQNHQGKMIIMHGGCSNQDLYYNDQLQAFAKAYSNIEYYSSVLDDKDSRTIDKIFLQHAAKYKTAKAYVCGPVEITKKLKTAAFLAGIASSNIYSDAFIY
ncbi:2Fe-2S iron-sulfur cluster binding domain-containing protein [Francisella sp. Scap27]|uniref:FAD-binding oxidoreductase n=1 Tax=Francisella sp. Scap27 TaxID=2589986 RepID=UPI0015BF27CF|nr:2Fe-2S iron-sulfur cluster binding domain-containing protein [Francisella sp. Scap27]QLE78907.1 2Fe-2S iron-sulfur cluster binding domain-containing protein [Francisella sp. Scap27]